MTLYEFLMSMAGVRYKYVGTVWGETLFWGTGAEMAEIADAVECGDEEMVPPGAEGFSVSAEGHVCHKLEPYDNSVVLVRLN